MSNRPGYYRRELKRLRKEFGGVCQNEDCGSVLGLEFAHVKPTGLNGRGRGTPQRVHDIKRNPTHYRLLCRRCHMALDFNGRDPWAPTDPTSEQEEVPF